MHLPILEEQRHSQTMHRRVPPPLVVKPALAVQRLEKLAVLAPPKELEVRDLEVAPEVAEIPRVPVGIPRVEEAAQVGEQEMPQGPGRPRGVRHGGPEVPCGFDAAAGSVVRGGAVERGGCAADLPEAEGVPVGLVAGGHAREGVVGDGAGKAHVRLEAPVPAEGPQGGVLREEARVEAAHVVVALAGDVGEGGVRGRGAGHGGAGAGGGDVRRVGPHVVGDEGEGRGGAGSGRKGGLEGRGEGLVVEEDERVGEVRVEGGFEGADGGEGAGEVAVAGEHYDGGVLAGDLRVGRWGVRGEGLGGVQRIAAVG